MWWKPAVVHVRQYLKMQPTNLQQTDRMPVNFPNADVVFIEFDGDKIAATCSPMLRDSTIYVFDVAAGEKITRKDGLALIKAICL